MTRTYESPTEAENGTTEESQMYNPDAIVFGYAEKYCQTLNTQDQNKIKNSRQLLFYQLTVYEQALDGEGEPQDSWTPLQLTIRYASKYAKSYLEQTDISELEAITAIQQDMTEEGRRLPYGVAEWIVHYATYKKTESLREGLFDSYVEASEERIVLDLDFVDLSE
ncbi:hypothetical protein [Natronosalvus caseinilyticus]|uniref:hypothetical protein n=1 Tax=Natronosalvus caseinilyticus TaxID=2953747 RepID=UPI0028AEF86D|nr:hypothetical protein [Natronosalvus caseinilyticus]